MSSVNFDMTKASNYLKLKYGEAGIILYNSMFPTVGMLQKDYDWKGGNFEEPVELSLGVGVGSGSSLPDAAVESVARVSFSDKNMYARARIANKLIEKAVGGESAFIDAYKHKWERTQSGFTWNIERCLFNDGTGALGTIDTSGVTNTDPTFACVISAATWKQFNWEVGILVNVTTGTDIYEVTVIDVANKKITMVRQAGGSQVPAAGNIVYMQNSRANDILGFKSITDATLGSTNLYGITAQYRWMPNQQLSVGVNADEELIDNAVLDIEATCGEGIDYIITSRKQWKVLKSANVGLKRYQVENPNVPAKFSVKLGFTALEYLSPVGSKTVPIMYSRFCEDDRMYFLNKSKTKLKHCNKPRFFERDGTVFLRTPDQKDDLEARYYSYMEMYMYPTYNGVVTGLN